MEPEDRVRLLQQAAAIEQGLAAVSGEDPGPLDASQVEEAALTVLAAVEAQYPYLREWIEQAVKFGSARSAVLLAEQVAEVTDAVKGKLASAADSEKWSLNQSHPPNADDPPRVLQAYASVARIAAGGQRAG